MIESGQQHPLFQRAQAHNSGLFSGIESMVGPLDSDARSAILGFLNWPSKANWDAAAHYLVKADLTMWQLWLQFDDDAPVRVSNDGGADRWPCVPDPVRMREALIALGRLNDQGFAMAIDYI